MFQSLLCWRSVQKTCKSCGVVHDRDGFNPYYAGDQFRSNTVSLIGCNSLCFNPYYAGDQFRSLIILLYVRLKKGFNPYYAGDQFRSSPSKTDAYGFFCFNPYYAGDQFRS